MPLTAIASALGSSAQSDALVEVLKACADPIRLLILRCLRFDSFSVSELCDILGMKQPTVSHHLKLLLAAGLVTVRKEGTVAFYRRVGTAGVAEDLVAVVKAVVEATDAQSLDDESADRIAQVKQERSKQAREFFNRHSKEFSRTQELIALPEQYLPMVLEMLRRSCSSPETRAVLEIGAGRGEFVASLLSLFRHVFVVDVAEEMLSLVEAAIATADRDRITIIHGDTAAAVASGVQVSHIVCNMVLHHVPSPVDIFRDCSLLLQPGGSLLVTDLCRHNQTWTIERCGDMWLGFEPLELSGFALHAGLVEVDNAYFGLRNGFQVQVRRFDKPS